MPETLRIAVVLAVFAACFGLGRVAVPPAPADDLEPVDVSQVRAQPLRFGASVDPGYQQLVAEAIAGARPEARALIEGVDGLVVFHVGRTEGDALGVTVSRGRRDFEVTVDVDRVFADHGRRGISRVVLHEFGHVVDRALLSDELRAVLDAGIPAGYGCEPGGHTGSCASRPERFAESFAKWAMNDIGADIYVGYKVPPPLAPLEEWARPLLALGV